MNKYTIVMDPVPVLGHIKYRIRDNHKKISTVWSWYSKQKAADAMLDHIIGDHFITDWD